MLNLLAWHNVIFMIPLVVGLLMVLGAAFGLADLAHGIDIDGDGVPDIGHLDHDGHGHDSDRGGALSFLGFGRVPLLLVIMTMALTFGATGMIANLFLAPLLAVTGLFSILSFAVALVVMVATTGTLSKLIASFMPTTETKSTVKTDLIGCTGTLVIGSDAKGGTAQVSKDGDVFQVSVRSDETLPKGLAILITEYDETADMYSVVRSPLDNK